ncbi:MAG: HD domain-containing protein [Candidatus Woesearchaeota archaeon]|nr:HD domain-containing protein [Candidatus Woesearchaeota archaeon]
MDIMDFYVSIDKIKHIERSGWKKIGVRGTRDTIASHSFGASLLAWVVAEKEGFDSSRMMKMLLIHDLIMAHVKDYMPIHEEYKDKRKLENMAAKDLLSRIPDEVRSEFTMLFEEYQEEKTEFSILARECDKLDTLLQSYMYSKRLGKDIFSEFLDSYACKIKSKTGKEMIKKLKEDSRF